MKNKNFVRSSKCSLKYNNPLKKIQLNILLKEYNKCLNIYIEFLWNSHSEGNIIKSKFLKKDHPEIDTFLSARILNSCINQASSVVRSRIEQIKTYQQILNNLSDTINPTQRQLDYKSALAERINNCNKTPVVSKLEMRIDSKNSKIDLSPTIKAFDLVVDLMCLGTNKFSLLTKKHKHFNSLLSKGKLLNGITVTENYIQFNFEFEKKINKNNKSIGIDLGICSCLTTSDNEQISSNDKGKPYHEIMKEIVRKRKGSKAFNKKLKERNNCSNYCVNQLDWNNISEICIEDIKNLRKCKKTNKIRRHWNYRFILDSLERISELNNVYLNKKNPMFTSQRCSSCGYVNSSNRKEEMFLCLFCGFATNADYNASINLKENLYPIKRNEIPAERKFFWDSSGIRLSGEEFEAPLFKNKI